MSTIHDFLGFDPATTETVDTFEGRPDPVPEGSYKMAATVARRQNNKNADGWFWYFEFTIIGGEYEGRIIIHRFNIINKNATAEQIGRGQMKKFLEVIGVPLPEDEDAMLGVAFVGTVKCKKDSFVGRNGEKIERINNEITRLDPLDGNEPKPQTAPTQEPAGDDTPPWGN